ncbi:MAG: TRAP transporter substrate-binding protein [Clostridia bacterium]|nr:TRAP transporter substrate-binding protein [Clostridia bacterium]
MKKLVSILLSLVMVLSMVSAASAVELVAADSTAKGAAGNVFAEKVFELVAQYSNGDLTVDYHGNNEMGGDADILRQVADGDIAICVNQTAPLVSFIPEMAVFDLPMVFAKYDAAKIDEVLNGDNEFTKALGAAYEAAGYHLLGFLQGATYRLTTSNKDIHTLEGFKGLQIRTMQNANHMAFWQAIGAEPTPLAWPEVYFSLQTGVIDAQENAADTCANANFQEVQKYIACTNHILYLNQICINAETWNELSDANKEALTKAVKDALAEIAPQLVEIDQVNKQKLQDGGVELIEYAPEFYDNILAMDGVKALYAQINADTNGLADLLVAELTK